MLSSNSTTAGPWFAALDYGFTHYTVCLLGCLDADGNTFVVDEHAERKWLPDRHAAAIKAMLARHGLAVDRLRRFVAGAHRRTRRKRRGGSEQKESPADRGVVCYRTLLVTLATKCSANAVAFSMVRQG